jgi:N-acyl-D-aspartate/D-glutamate deacylase
VAKGTRQVLRGATIVDGTGGRARRADIEVVGDRIGAIGTVDPAGDGVVDLDGLVLAPGFVDVHTHFDAQVFWDPDFTPSSQHGVTSVIEGNCGFGLAPTRPEDREYMMETLEVVEGMRLATLTAGIDWSFETFPEYMAAMRRLPLRLNLGVYIGHTALRTYVMGTEASTERAATGEELERMRSLVEEAMVAGAAGFSTSLALTHVTAKGRPVPSRFATPEELRTLTGAVAASGRGIVDFTYGPPFRIEEVAQLSRDLGVRITWGSLITGIHGGPGAALGLLEQASAVGGDFWPQVSCREIVFQMTMMDPYYLAASSAFGDLLAQPRGGRAALYRDQAWRDRARGQVEQVRPGAFRRVSIQETERHTGIRRIPMAELAAERGVDPFDLWIDLALEEDLTTRFRVVAENDDMVELRQLLQDPRTVLGAHDAGAHIDMLCDAGFPSYFLGHWVRDEGIMSLEQGVWKLTGQPASLFGLSDRGRIASGWAADLVAFDPHRVEALDTERQWDFPAGGDHLISRSVGIDSVWVNGVPIRRGGSDLEGVSPGVIVP